MGNIKVIAHTGMVRVKRITNNGQEIGTILCNAKNYAYAHQGKFLVYSCKYGESARFHKLSSAIRFCL